jgi:hypothetical protein
MSSQNPLFPPLPSGVFDRWLSDNVANGAPPVWDRLWFNPGRVPQSAELNEMQSMLWTYLGRVCEIFFVEGQIISGLVPTLSGTTVTISAGFMYIQGRVRPIASGTATITGTGSETVGLLYTNTTLTPQSDSELMNPVTTTIVGPQQYSLLGASRMSMTFAWASDSSAGNYTPIFYYVNGVLQFQAYASHSPYVFVPMNATPVFNCGLGTPDLVVFQFSMTGAVTSSTITNLSPGQAVKFIISTSGTTALFPWPSLVLGGGSAGGADGFNYTQSFITTGSPNCLPDSGMTVYPPLS